MMQTQILLVEDNTVLCEVLERNLLMRGYAVTVAQNVAEAVASLCTRDFHLVLLDIHLPDQTSWDLLRTLGHFPDIHLRRTTDGRLPVVVLSAVRVSSGRLEEFRPLAYLPKPFPLEAVLRLASQVQKDNRSVSTV
jgi:DNA-binding response OmpR family regulator